MPRIRSSLSQPLQSSLNLFFRRFPGAFFARNSRCTRSLGLTKPTAILSFDCDTFDDAKASVQVHHRLLEMGIKPVYAVPGELLVKCEDAYSVVLDCGGTFLNHGGYEHTAFNEPLGRYVSTGFYDEIGSAAVSHDFRLGHELVTDFCGKPPIGFRSPHFGTYSAKGQLAYIHALASSLNYSYSSSSTPYWAFRRGPAHVATGLIEFPVSGRSSSPLTILDSWSAFGSPSPSLTPQAFRDELIGWVEAAKSFGPIFLNIYADPSHVYNEPMFFEAMEMLTSTFDFRTFDEVIERIRNG